MDNKIPTSFRFVCCPVCQFMYPAAWVSRGDFCPRCDWPDFSTSPPLPTGTDLAAIPDLARIAYATRCCAELRDDLGRLAKSPKRRESNDAVFQYAKALVAGESAEFPNELMARLEMFIHMAQKPHNQIVAEAFFFLGRLCTVDFADPVSASRIANRLFGANSLSADIAQAIWRFYHGLEHYISDCGNPEELQFFPLSLFDKPIEMSYSEQQKEFLGKLLPRHQSTFISYGSPDEAAARRIVDALEARGVRTWFFPRDAEPGTKLHRAMREAINVFDRMILICSKHSLIRKGVLFEIEQVLQRESREGGASILIPVAIDDFIFKDWRPENPGTRQELLDRVVARFYPNLAFDTDIAKLIKALEIRSEN